MSRLAFLALAATALAAPALAQTAAPADSLAARLGQYTTVRLTADLSGLSDSTRAMLPHLVAAARAMDDIFWAEASGGWDDARHTLAGETARRYVAVNYGPWDRLAGNAPFLPGVGPKPAGSGFYPADMTRDELLAAAETDPTLTSLYTVVRRDAAGRLVSVPYHVAFAEPVARAAAALRAAASLAEDAGLRRYLTLRAAALETDDYRPSDVAWMQMRTNPLDIVVGPVETYEDALAGGKAAHEAYVLVRDAAWSARLQQYAALLPELQRGLPVPDAYRAETPGSDADLAAYDAVYYAGDANAGSKTIAINLPNDETVQLEYGSRRLQLKNAMQAKFDRILVPLANVLLTPEQAGLVTFEAFFGNTMFHEVAHGLGIKNTVAGTTGAPVRTVREALLDHASAVEEGKADVLGLYMVERLIAGGQWTDATLEQHYATFIASIFRSIRFGTASAHGRANLVRLNFFAEQGAVSVRDDGRWSVDTARMPEAVRALAARLLMLQGDGDYAAVDAFVTQYGQPTPALDAALARIAAAGIPVDVVFEQGLGVLGLEGN